MPQLGHVRAHPSSHLAVPTAQAHRAINSAPGTCSQLLLQIPSPQMYLVVLLLEGTPSSLLSLRSLPFLSVPLSIHPRPHNAALALVLQVWWGICKGH